MDEASATDNCGEVSISVEEVTIPGDCPGNYVITRTFTATDDCGNATSDTQTITIVDTTALNFASSDDYTAECSENHPMSMAAAVDNCNTVVVKLKK